MAQSSLSALVRRFEAAVGCTVFSRTSRRVELSPEGVFILETVDRVLLESAALTPESDEGESVTGYVRLGAIPTLGPYLFPSLLPPLIDAFPEARYLLTEALTEQLIGALQADRLDAAILSLPVGDHGLEQTPLFEEELVLALPAAHPLAAAPHVARDDVPAGEVILMEHGHCLRDNTLQVCGGVGSVVPAHATGVETLLGMVAAGVGCAVVPSLAARIPRALSERVAWRRIHDPTPTRTIGVAFRPSTPSARRVRRLLEVIRSTRLETDFSS